jgi:hypothetical protein
MGRHDVFPGELQEVSPAGGDRRVNAPFATTILAPSVRTAARPHGTERDAGAQLAQPADRVQAPGKRREATMPTPWMTALFGIALLAVSPLSAQSFSASEIAFFRTLNEQPNDLARYLYVLKMMPQFAPHERQLAMQMFASVENELGFYNEAMRDFPLKSRVPADTTLPTADGWKAASAVDVVARLAADRRIVMVNEAHHDAHTRELTLALLPRLRALGFDYFAVEALGKDRDLARRGYPLKADGSDYLHEPLYGEIVRQALRLGFTVVAYDTEGARGQARETGQANNLYRRVFAHDPAARLFVHAGYAHIDKARGRLGAIDPMAMRLQKLTGLVPLSIDQTQFREQIPAAPDEAYQQLVTRFEPTGPTVLLDRTDGHAWSAHPELYDLNVILPGSGMSAVESGYTQRWTMIHNTTRTLPMLSHEVNAQRPPWLTLGGGRNPLTISTTLCKAVVPCVVDAHYPDEPDDAVAADRYAFLQGDTVTKLYLYPGRYRLRAWGINGNTLSDKFVEVRAP